MSSPRFPSLRERQSVFAESLSAFFSSNAFENRYMFHPTRIPQAAAETVECFLRFVESGEKEPVVSLGRSLERQGLAEKSLLAILPQAHAFCASALASQPSAALAEALDLAVSFGCLLFAGFGAEQREEILSDQEQLRRALSTAIESQSRELLVRNQAIATSFNGIVLADLAGRISYVNQSFLAMLGFEQAEEALGLQFGDLWSDEDGRAILDRISSRGGWRGEYSATRKDGAALTVLVSASHITDQVGTAIGIMASLVDVTESRRLETQMQQVQKMDDLGQLAGGIVHDFNNLLTAIGGYLQLVLLDVVAESHLYQDLMQIKIAVDRGSGLTKQLYYFTRQATGKRQPVSVNDLVQETYELLRRTLPAAIAIRVDLADSPWLTEADPNQLSQVVMNLCVNAREAIMERAEPDGELVAAGTILIETRNVTLSEDEAKPHVNAKAGKYLLLRVSDTGVGIPPELVKRLFIPFVTTKVAKRGTGLGLSVVYGIVSSHGGFVAVSSEMGRGTSFEVYLPTAEASAATRAPKRVKVTLPAGEGTILVVDDEEQVRQVMVRSLKLCGYRTLAAESGTNAIALYLKHPGEIDLVILDVVMPAMGGRETFLKLKEIDPAVSVLLVTGYTTDRIVHLSDELGAKGLIEKPLDIQRFTERVGELIMKKGA